MTQPTPRPAFGWPANRLLAIAAFICWLIAALAAAGVVTSIGSAWAWFFGGWAAVALSWAVP